MCNEHILHDQSKRQHLKHLFSTNIFLYIHKEIRKKPLYITMLKCDLKTARVEINLFILHKFIYFIKKNMRCLWAIEATYAFWAT